MKNKGVLIILISILIINLTLSTKVLAYSNSNESEVRKLNDLEFNPDNLDFEFLKEKIKDKKIIGIGDNGLGIRESNLAKYNLTSYLINSFNYKTIVIDAPVGATEMLNSYVSSDEYPLDEAIKELIILNHNTEEFRNFLKWVRKYNEGKPLEERVFFQGRLDYTIDSAVLRITSYLKKVDDKLYEKSKQPLFMTAGFTYNYYYLDLTDPEEIYREINEIYNTFLENKDEYIGKSSKREYHLNLNLYNVVIKKITDLVNLERGIQLENRNNIELSILKDILNISYENKAIVWSGNMNLTGSLLDDIGEFTRLGYLLKNEYEEDYFSIATDIYEGQSIVKLFNYSDVTNRLYDEFPIYREKAPLPYFEGGLIESFSTVPYNTFYVDSKGFNGNLHGNSLNLDERTYGVKSIKFNFKNEFNGIIYTKKTTAVNNFSTINKLRENEPDHRLFLFIVSLLILIMIFSTVHENIKVKKSK